MKTTLLTIACTTAITLASYAQTQLWGTTNRGGKYGAGTIFKTDSAGANHTVEHDFYKTPGINPIFGKMVQAPNGKLYGVTYEGGAYNAGVLFEYDPTTVIYTAKHNFNAAVSPNNGGYPEGQLLLANDGNLYGTTDNGGLNNSGMLFQYNYVTDTLINKFNFEGTTTGQYAIATLMQANNGLLYGVCSYGGLNNAGTLFSYNITTDTLIVKANFTGANGKEAYGELIQATDGNLYGQTYSGGTNNTGTLFSYNITTDTLIAKVSLTITTGRRAFGGLVQAYNGKLYATTTAGGTNGVGTLYEYDYIADTLIVKVNFTNPTTGGRSYCALLQLNDSTLYGTTYGGGASGYGTIFQYSPNTDTVIVKFNFNTANGGAGETDASLMLATDGNLYGFSYSGGTANKGSLYQYNLSTDTVIVKVSFGDITIGANPEAGLLKASNGKLYGTTTKGGVYNGGVLFEYDMATKTYTKKFDFNNSAVGSNPQGSLMQASSGLLYGTTSTGGVNGYGTLFTYNPITDTLIVKVSFNYSNGHEAKGSPIEASNGMLYGTTYGGGMFGNGGVLYKYNPITDTLIVTHNFDMNGIEGAFPSATVLQGFNGKIYGTAEYGNFNDGAIFEYDITTDSLVVVKTFTVATGVQPVKGLIQGKDSLLYGVTLYGGANSQGTMYAYNLVDNTLIVKIDLNNTTGTNLATLLQANDGNIYGLAKNQGGSNSGALFQYNLANSATTIQLYFDGVLQGAIPTGELIEVGNTLSTAAVNTLNCGGSAIIVPYTAQAAFNANNVFTVQLSDAAGSFATPTIVGTLVSSIASPIVVTLPNTAGTGYLIRVVSSSPALIGASNGVNITINASGTSTQTLNLCAGQSTTVGTNTYTTSGTYVDVFPTAGCDSTVTTNLTVNPVLNTTTATGDSITATVAGATYQWIDCGTNTAIASATNQSYTATVTGSYAAVVTLNGCTDTSACVSIIITNTKAINTAAVISAYPNPNNGTFSITTATYGTYTIANELGQVVSTFTTNANATTAHIAGLASGVYVIKNTENGTIARTKIVVTQ